MLLKAVDSPVVDSKVDSRGADSKVDSRAVDSRAVDSRAADSRVADSAAVWVDIQVEQAAGDLVLEQVTAIQVLVAVTLVEQADSEVTQVISLSRLLTTMQCYSSAVSHIIWARCLKAEWAATELLVTAR